MARIPLGNFAAPAQAPAPVIGVTAPGGRDFVGQAVERLGETGEQVASNALEVQQREKYRQMVEAKQKADAMARAKAADATLNYGLQVKAAQMDVQDKISRGDIPYQQGESAFSTAVDQITPPAPGNLDPALAVTFNTGLKSARENARLQVRQSVLTAQDDEFKSTFGSVLDKLGKMAGFVGADVARINAQADSFAPLARQAGLSEAQVTKTLQDFKDNNWTQQATQRAMLARNDVGQLDQIAADLGGAKGFYADKLDANKRNAILSQVLNRKQLLLDRAAHAQDRADAAGARVINQMDEQIASGVPATPEMFADWADKTKGTASAADFDARVKDYDTVQKVLRMSPAEQQTYLQQAQAKLLSGGGSVHDKTMLDRTTTAVNASIQQMRTDPLLWNQSRLGDAVEPINVADLPQLATSGELATTLQQRAATLDAMRKQYGTEVPMKLLLPQEADGVSRVLEQASPKQQAALFGAMKNAAGNDAVYAAVMQQIAPKSPVLAYAGKIMGTGRPAIASVETHWFSPNVNVAMSAQDVAQTMLDGEALIKPDEKGAAKFPMPADAGVNGLRAVWATVVGDGFRGDGGSDAQAYQAFRAMYAGLAAKAGKSDGVLDTDIATMAARASIGNVGEWNDKIVIPPYGMDFGKFTDAANTAWASARAHVPGAAENDLGAYDLDRIGDGVYVVSNGQAPVRDANGKPVILRIAPSGTTSTSTPRGLITAGNIDLMHRPVVKNDDGTYSTVRSISISEDGKEVLIPTVIGDRVVSNKEAIAHYKKTGEHLGIFDSIQDANAYAETLHEQQAKLYGEQ